MLHFIIVIQKGSNYTRTRYINPNILYRNDFVVTGIFNSGDTSFNVETNTLILNSLNIYSIDEKNRSITHYFVTISNNTILPSMTKYIN